jgi:bifunctional DNase/RNase
MSIEMKIKGLMMDPINGMPIIVLKDPQGDAVLPIWVGLFEANAIALQIEKIGTPRPMTHDLLKSFLASLGAHIENVVQRDGQRLEIDSRPSDAIALALRSEAAIFVEEDVITRAKTIDMAKDAGESDRLRQWLEKLDPEDLGKYEM